MQIRDIASDFAQHIKHHYNARKESRIKGYDDIVLPETFTFYVANKNGSGTVKMVIICFNKNNLHIEDYTSLIGFKKVTMTTLDELEETLTKQSFITHYANQKHFNELVIKS